MRNLIRKISIENDTLILNLRGNFLKSRQSRQFHRECKSIPLTDVPAKVEHLA